ncbi:hypothetical protein [Marinospirillum alkaliphilum]|uniref:Uncharacterized protein n=1 Tax=Marinospirillum alkaliphilum DSM 21637 TaxID=1122209 RepID=A0A1K1UX23_9GAMM|nr:hypothetical protein [Marinospirillum alkaliphilum]SFX17344.1 hypothetical protein SAMN02745752_00649 [Marinospirillum alkaliphilum DSM 21637]
MSNSDVAPRQALPTVETVRPDNGRDENRWVLLLTLTVLLLGALGVLLRQTQAPMANLQPELSLHQQQLLMELAIAADEIRFLALPEFQQTGHWPDRQQLLAEGLLPVLPGQSVMDWQQPEAGCLLLPQPNLSAAFLMRLQTDSIQLYFTDHLTTPVSCDQLDHWFPMNKLP